MTTTLLELAADIKAAHREACGAMRTGLTHARRAGDLLLQAKRCVPYGQWLPFLTQCAELAPRTAQDYMRVAKHWPRIEAETRGGAHLPLHEALRFLRVPPLTGPLGARATTASWGDLSEPERAELRRIVTELETFPFVAKTLTPVARGQGGAVTVTPGAAGAPVYWDIVGGDPESGRPVFQATRRSVREAIVTFLTTGRRSVVSDLAADVARRRIAGDRGLRKPSLPPAAGDRADLGASYPVRLRLPFELMPHECAEVARLCGQAQDGAALIALLRRALAREALESVNDPRDIDAVA